MYCTECKRKMDQQCVLCVIKTGYMPHVANMAKSIDLALKRNDQISFDKEDWAIISAILKATFMEEVENEKDYH